MRRSHLACLLACVAWSAVSGCAATSPPPAEPVSPVVAASTSGGCLQPVHGPMPLYGTEIPFTSPPRPARKVAAVPPGTPGERVSGTVTMAALVCEHGRVMATRVLKSVPTLDAAATDAVRLWEFKPALIGDVPVAVWTTIPVKVSSR